MTGDTGGPARAAATIVLILAVGLWAGLLSGCASTAPSQVLDQQTRFDRIIALPEPDLDGAMSLESAIAQRRSQRDFSAAPVSSEHLGQLLWAGQGITNPNGYRTAPSAGARYPIELYTVTADEIGHYLPDGHRFETRSSNGTLERLADVAFGQGFVSDPPLVIAVIAVPSRTEAEYGAVADALVDREAGHVAQNILLQATALDLASVPVGGFDPAAVATELALPPGWDVRYLIPIG